MKVQKDFKRKKVKIGKKVAKANATKVNVQSKRIIVPNQHHSNLTQNSTEQDTFQRIHSKLRHTSEPTRVNGLTELEEFVRKSQNISKYFSLAVADVFELLLNNEPKFRDGVLNVMKAVVSSKTGECLVGNMQLVVSFLCGAMSSVNKVINSCS
jgi:hypothetical protein